MITIGEKERILSIRRRHSFVLFAELFPVILILMILFGFLSYFLVYQNAETVNEYFNSIPYFPDLEINYYYFIFFVILSLILIIWQFIFVIFTHFYLDCWIITNERTIHTELRTLFSRFYSSVSHDRIQDVTVDIHGFFPTIFKYGDLKIQTAGAFKNFIFNQISDPYKTKDILLNASNNFRSSQNNRNYQNKL